MMMKIEDFNTNAETTVDIYKLEQSIENKESVVGILLSEEDKLSKMLSIAKESKANDVLSPQITTILATALESSLLTLGLPHDVIKDKQIVSTEAMLTKEQTETIRLIEKINYAVGKIFAKISRFVRKVLLKVLTTMNFNKKNLKILLDGFKNKKINLSKAEFSEKESSKLVKQFATLAVLTGKIKDFEISDIEQYLLSVLNSNEETIYLSVIDRALKKYSKLSKEGKADYREILDQETQKDDLNKEWRKSFQWFTLSDKELDIFRIDSAHFDLLRIDGSNISVIVKIVVDEFIFVQIMKSSIRPKIMNTLNLTGMPTAVSMVRLLEAASKSNDEIKNNINSTFKRFEDIDKSFKEIEGGDKNEEEKKALMSGAKNLYLVSPKIAMGSIMNVYKTIRNIIALGNIVIDKSVDEQNKPNSQLLLTQ